MVTEIGIVNSISSKNNAVQIDGKWYNLGPLVKLNYIKKDGECEYRWEEAEEEGDNPTAVYVRMTAKPTAPVRQPTRGTEVPARNVEQENRGFKSDEEKESMKRMSALKASSLIYQGIAAKTETGIGEFKALTDQIVEYIDKGLWVERKKVAE